MNLAKSLINLFWLSVRSAGFMDTDEGSYRTEEEAHRVDVSLQSSFYTHILMQLFPGATPSPNNLAYTHIETHSISSRQCKIKFQTIKRILKCILHI